MDMLLANAVLTLHVAFVAFVILALPCIFIGKFMHWRWVRLYWLRLVHLVSIGIVTAQAWAGVICPLTTLEMWLRDRAGGTTYTGSFIEYWLQQLLYWNFPAWVFVLAYSIFTLVVIASWYLVPPFHSSGRSRRSLHS